MPLNALEIGFFENLLRETSLNAKAITEITSTPEQLADELKYHAQKELDAQWLQNQFTANDIPSDYFQRQNQTQPDEDDDPNPSAKKPSKPTTINPLQLPQRVKQWLG